MTGPGEGKIPLETEIFIGNKRYLVKVDGNVYLHIKGYSLARVTHLDIEGSIFNQIIPPKKHLYGILSVKDRLKIFFRRRIYIKELDVVVDRLILSCPKIVEVIGQLNREWVY
ncbi:MAG TPA: hypothetical protein ENG40_04645, partial [Thermoprotei archaeon]|nr:hypothetical protein [Thermoprotei archaeon]